MAETDAFDQPQYPVTIWEGIGIAVGSVALMAIGSAGLIYTFFNNAADPRRAMAIAHSLMDYQIPGGAQGVFGANLGGAKIAIVSSPTFPRDTLNLSESDAAKLSGVELFIARVPLDVETADNSAIAAQSDSKAEPYDIFSSPDFSVSYRSGEDFKPTADRTDSRPFCGITVPVRIQEGQLTIAPQLPPIAAVKYDAIAVLENNKRQITLTAIGSDAQQQAEVVFNSLSCK